MVLWAVEIPVVVAASAAGMSYLGYIWAVGALITLLVISNS